MATPAGYEESREALERIRDVVGVDRRRLWAALIGALEEVTLSQVQLMATSLRDEGRPIRLSRLCQIVNAGPAQPSKFFDAVALEYVFPAQERQQQNGQGHSVSEAIAGDLAPVFSDLSALSAASIINDDTQVDLPTGEVRRVFRVTAFGRRYGNAFRDLVTNSLGKYKLNGFAIVADSAGLGKAIVKQVDAATTEQAN